MASKIFIVASKSDGTKTLVKADTKAQVTAYIRANFVISQADAIEAVSELAAGATLVDATTLTVAEAVETPAETAATVETAESADQADSSEASQP